MGLENGDEVSVIDVATLKELGRIPIGQAPQALVYVSDDVAGRRRPPPHAARGGQAPRGDHVEGERQARLAAWS